MEKGLTLEQAQEKLKEIGKNEISSGQSSSAIKIFLSQFPSFVNLILFTAAIFSFVIKSNLDAIFILAILILSAFLGFIQEYRAEKSLEKLKNFITPLSRVIRNGKPTRIQSNELVPGDVVVINEGERIPADATLIVSHNIEADESLLSGESLPVIKKQNDQVFSGTLITKGKGVILIEKTGLHTRLGQIAETLVGVKSDKTPLQIQLQKLGKTLSVIIFFIALSIIPIGIAQGRTLLPLAILAISIGVAAIPESLPAVVTIALAIGTNRMARKNAIVRKMSSVETLGTTQVLLIDKTGTLTQNSMRVKKSVLRKTHNLNLLLKMCVIGNTAELIQKKNTNDFDIVGDKTDGALLLFAKENIKDLEKIKSEGEIIDEYTFDYKTKIITTLWKENGKINAFVRGAPETLLERSKLNGKEKKEIRKSFESLAGLGLRVIGFSHKIISRDDSRARKELEKNLEFIGFVGIYDPPRKEVKESVHAAKIAGLHTVIVTGDNPITALTIAKEIGLIEENEDVVTGEELAKFDDDELTSILPKTRIFARTTPEDKLRLVTLFKKMGFVVGVTGDGVNDALALKKADVGIAMGEKGTDVAKEASDIVLTDDNFSTLISAIAEGRTIYKNILKSITYLLASNLSEISLIIIAIILGLPSPLLPTQILWINLVTDGLPALALASDSKNNNILRNAPIDSHKPILSNHRLIFILTTGFFLSLIFITLFKILLSIYSIKVSGIIIFNTLIATHMLLAFIIRGQNIFKINKFLILSAIFTLLLQLFVNINPFFSKLLHLAL